MLLRIPLLLPPPVVALATLSLVLILTPPHSAHAKEEEGSAKYIGHYYGQRFGRNQPDEQVAENDDDDGGVI